MTKMVIKIDELFECTGKRDNLCFILGCISYSEKSKKFIVCNHFKLKQEYAVYKK